MRFSLFIAGTLDPNIKEGSDNSPLYCFCQEEVEEGYKLLCYTLSFYRLCNSATLTQSGWK